MPRNALARGTRVDRIDEEALLLGSLPELDSNAVINVLAALDR